MANAINSLKYGNNTYIFTLPYGSCSTAAATAAKTVTVSNFSLETGARVAVKFTVTNTASSPTLNVNSTGAKAIYYKGSAISAGYLAANKTYEFVYNGTQWDLLGDVDTNYSAGDGLSLSGTTFKVSNKYYFNNHGTYVKLGTLTMSQHGDYARLEICTGDGYNAALSQNRELTVHIRTGNGTATSSNTYYNGYVEYGLNGNDSTDVYIVQNSSTSYDLYIGLTYYPGDSFVIFHGGNGVTFAYSGGSTSSLPTTAVKLPQYTKAYLSSTVASATKATQDASGNTITSTYATKSELNTAKSALQTSIDSKAASSHTHSYAGSSSAGGAATSANKLNTNAGSATQPVYFSNGVPVKTTYTLGKSVPSNAVFTDTNTHYTSKNVVGSSTATSNTTSALTNGNVYLNSVENGVVTSTHKISGSGATTVTTDTSGNIIIKSTDNNTTYGAAGSSLGLVKSGGDVTISSGVITVNDDSHNHTIANVDNLQTTIDAINTELDGSIKSLSVSGKVITYTKNDGTTGTITTQDTNTTYSTMGGATTSAAGKAGLVPAPAAGKNASFLRGDGSWVVPTNTTYSNFVKSGSGAKAGLVPAPSTTAGTTKYLREDGTWTVPPNTTYSAATTSANGLMTSAMVTKLNGIAAGANAYTLPTASSSTLGGVKTTSTVTSTSGYTACPIISGVPYYKDTNTTYSAGTGISLSGTTFSNSGVRSISTGSSNGTISVNTNGTTTNVAVKGLGSAAYTASSAYALATHTHNYLPLNGGNMSGNINMNNKEISNVKNLEVIGNSFGLYFVGVSNQDVRLKAGSLSNNVYLMGSTVFCANIDATENVPIYASAFTVPSSRLTKDNIHILSEEEASKILELDVVSFDYIEKFGGKKNQRGLIAEDVVNIIPSCVNIPKDYDESNFDEEKGIINSVMSIDYSKLVPYLIKIVQMQENRITQLESTLKNS